MLTHRPTTYTEWFIYRILAIMTVAVEAPLKISQSTKTTVYLLVGLQFLPLDEATAFRAVFVFVSGSDGRKRFWGQQYWKTVSDMYVSKGANWNTCGRWAGHRMSSSRSLRRPTPNRGFVNRRPQIEHIMSGRRAAWSPLWWWPCCIKSMTRLNYAQALKWPSLLKALCCNNCPVSVFVSKVSSELCDGRLQIPLSRSVRLHYNMHITL